MAVRVLRSDPPTPERIRRQRRPVTHRRDDDHALDVMLEVVRLSETIDDAIAAVKSVNAAWVRVPAETREENQLLLTILELSDTVDGALEVFTRLRYVPSALSVLSSARERISSHYGNADALILPGDDDPRLGQTFLYALIPAESYTAFKVIYDSLAAWWLKTYPDIGSTINIAPRRKAVDV